jgi:hypothetical protein
MTIESIPNDRNALLRTQDVQAGAEGQVIPQAIGERDHAQPREILDKIEDALRDDKTGSSEPKMSKVREKILYILPRHVRHGF